MKRKRFLLELAKKILSQYGDQISQIVLVFPSRRSSVFFFDELSQLIDKPIWLPQVFSIDDLLFQINNTQRVNQLELFLDFYNIYSNIVQKPHSIERCYKWAYTLLKDLDDIDQSCINYKELFNYLSDVKRIENWYLDINENKTDINEYLDFFKNLTSIYEALKTKLLDKNVAYSGLAQRVLADQPKRINNWLEVNKKQRLVFIGLDALTIAQERIIDHLLKDNLCDIWWDTDKYFVDNDIQEAGQFLRKYRKKWPSIFTDIANDFLNTQRSIDIIGATKSINQVKVLSNFLKDKSYSESQLKRIGIILTDEDLLLSVLESIPKEIQNINITMGYKLKHHPISSFFKSIFELHINSRKIKLDAQKKSKHFLSKDLMNLLHDPFFQQLIKAEEESLYNRFFTFLEMRNLNYVSLIELASSLPIKKNTLINELFVKNIGNALDLLTFFKKIIAQLIEFLSKKEKIYIFQEECLFALESHFQIFESFLRDTNETLDIKLFYQLFKQILDSIKLNFSGEPLRGLQIMGLLESRTIDFDEVFILSANEKNLPPSSNTTSFIPFETKMNLGMSTYLDQDAIYANHFFNLIKRPQKSHIIYDQDLSSFYSGEKSRFINQLIYEIKQVPNNKINIQEHTFTNLFNFNNDKDLAIMMKKDEYIMNALSLLCQKGLSPSTINTYNTCKRKFYFEKLLGVSIDDKNKNELNASIIGTIIHEVLERLYKPHMNVVLDSKIMTSIKNRISQEITVILQKNKVYNINRGKNLLAMEAIRRIIVNFINHEVNLIKQGNTIVIKFLEYKTQLYSLANNLVFNNLGQPIQINLKGHIDRIDVFNGVCRVIDYKTGLVQDSDLKCNTLSSIKKFPKLLQLLMYALILNKEQSFLGDSFLVGVINLRAIDFEFQPCIINKKNEIDSSILLEFESALLNNISEIFDQNETFEHLDRVTKCVFCD